MAHVRWFLFTMAQGLLVDGLNGSANEAGGRRHDRKVVLGNKKLWSTSNTKGEEENHKKYRIL